MFIVNYILRKMPSKSHYGTSTMKWVLHWEGEQIDDSELNGTVNEIKSCDFYDLAELSYANKIYYNKRDWQM